MYKILASILISLIVSFNVYAEEFTKCSFWKGVNSYDDCIAEHEYEDGLYIGLFKNGVPNGEGKWQGKDGLIYNGEFLDFKFNGSGTLEFTIGDKYKYVGEFLNNELHGQGIFTWDNGDRYIGEHKNNKRDGQGVFNYNDGASYSGTWKDGEKNGKGKLTWPDGSTYEGEFVNGIREGEGIFF